MASPRLIERLRAENVLRPHAVVEEAKRAGLRLPLACALLEKESGGGRNVFGHDPTIFVGAGEVTRAKYTEYKRRRVASGNRLMQGVGPCQLTWWEFQDAADREGGCWRPEINMRIGFRHLAALIAKHGEAEGARMYNGSGPAAEAYSRDFLAKARAWEAKLAGLPEPVPARRGGVVRRGDEGPLVRRITGRLSRVTSPRTGRPYLDGPRRHFDGEAEAALKAFQAEHRLEADGVYGPASAQALNRAVALEREHRRQPRRPRTSVPKTRGVRPPEREGLKGSDPPRERGRERERGRRPERPRRAASELLELVREVERDDAETDRSWQELTEYARRRRRLLAELRGGRVDFGDLATVLLRIEDKLETLVELEQAEAAAADEPPAGTSGTEAAGPAATRREAGAAKAAEPAGDAVEGSDPGGSVAEAAEPGERAAEVAEPASGPSIAAAPSAARAQATNGAGEAAPQAPAGGAPPEAPAAEPRRRKPSELTDAELERRIERLDREIGEARGELIARYARTEKELARLLPRERRQARPRGPRRRGEKPLAPPERKQKAGPAPKAEPRPRPKAGPRAEPAPRPLPKAPPRPLPSAPPRPKPTTLTKAEVRRLQMGLNRFTERYLRGVGPLIVDGVKGPATAKRITMVKYHLGYTGKAQRSATVKPDFVRRMRHARSPRYSSPAMLARAAVRRAKQRKRAKLSAAPRMGVTTFDGKPVAAWMKPYLEWARANGWKGSLTSGFRDPAHSERVCMEICGAPSCPGRCAGRSSNHVGNGKPNGAIDVSDYVTFGRLMQRCPYSPRIYNALGPADPVHFSSTGR